uniref:Uncharacterized protein n=1 Tax=Ixodes ricinus TaxID=34613 RepID=A0A6B0UP12_IXORI
MRNSVATFLIFFIVRPFGLLLRVALIAACESVKILACGAVALFPAMSWAAANIALNSASLTVVPDCSNLVCVLPLFASCQAVVTLSPFFAASVYRTSSFGACVSHHAACIFAALPLFPWLRT